ncbi:fatty acyl-AMP ligase [Streptomyces sp. NPDC048281]|uniref:fatty acyl-AMP ligase n=1 Tax=Streptomyces sp. NPDC048281 TaxID=3154715 RepID=UPI00341A74A8
MSIPRDVPRDTQPPRSIRPLTSVFADLYRTDPDRCLFVFTDVHGEDAARRTVGDLARRAEGIRQLLSDGGVKPGERVVLVHLPSLEFVEAFLGCLAAGVLPVPVAPPNPFALEQDLARVSAVADDCGAQAILTHQDYLAVLDAAGSGEVPARSRQPWLVPDLDESGTMPFLDLWHRPSDPDEPAYLQFTSGTTGPPKCVTVSHRNMHHEIEALAEDLCLDESTVAVAWVPHYHDMGLVCVLLSTLAGNSGRTYLISPLDFLLRPAVWFDVLSRVRGTHTSGPHFALDLMCRKTTEEQRAGWDLSSVQVFSAGAEIVRTAAVEAFFETFRGTGLDSACFHPGYGLAEHTMSLAMGSGGPLALDRDQLARGRVVRAKPGPDHHRTVCYGAGWAIKPDTSLRVVDPESRLPCGPDEVGEIWVDSPTKALGYWGREQATRETFHAEIGDGDPRRYLRTGDVGFLRNGELYVTGRLQDLIVIDGLRHQAEDIEEAVRGCHPGIRRGGVAAFSVPADPGGPEQRLIMLVESTGEPADLGLAEEIRQAVRTQIETEFGITPAEVVVGRKLVRKTTSGKVRRRACRDEYLAADGLRGSM